MSPEAYEETRTTLLGVARGAPAQFIDASHLEVICRCV
jgi:hypothetical protein